MSKVKVIDNILSEQMLHFCYNSMIGMPIWKIDMKSHSDSEYNIVGNTLFDKHMNIGDKGKGQLLATMIYILIKEKAKFLSDDIQRIHIGAKGALQDDILHTDSDKEANTVLFYLNPTWKKEWGGETIVDGKKIEYKSNRAVIYDARLPHGGKAPKGPHLRTYINYVIGK
jgi:hypothetical protein